MTMIPGTDSALIYRERMSAELMVDPKWDAIGYIRLTLCRAAKMLDRSPTGTVTAQPVAGSAAPELIEITMEFAS